MKKKKIDFTFFFLHFLMWLLENTELNMQLSL